jgi:divalent metal cation (Fe/Co/Zn/Cd) transporter
LRSIRCSRVGGAGHLWQGWRLIRSSIGGLMDEAVDDEALTASAGRFR